LDFIFIFGNGKERGGDVSERQIGARDDSLGLGWKCNYAKVGSVESSRYYLWGKTQKRNISGMNRFVIPVWVFF